MQKFLIWCSGADTDILDRCPTDRPKYVGLGGAILFTTALAFFAFQFAMVSALDAPLLVASFGAAIWAAGIFNLDRWLVSAFKRRPTLWGNVAAFLPRFFLAFALGLVISEPLIQRIFEPEIAKTVQTMAIEDAASNEKALLKDPRYKGMPAMKDKIVLLQAQVDGAVDTSAVINDPEVEQLAADLKVKEAELAAAQAALNCEVEGQTACTGSSEAGSGKVGWGPAAGEKVRTRDEARTRRDAAQRALDAKKAAVAERLGRTSKTTRATAAKELRSLRAKYKDLEVRQKAERDAFLNKNADSAGLLARMAALERLAAREPMMGIAQWALRIFIVLIDAMPVLIKFLMTLFPASLYERELERVEAEKDIEQAEALAERREVLRLNAEVNLHEATVQNELKLTLAEEISELVVDAEREIALTQITMWKDGVLADIQANPGAYIIT